MSRKRVLMRRRPADAGLAPRPLQVPPGSPPQPWGLCLLPQNEARLNQNVTQKLPPPPYPPHALIPSLQVMLSSPLGLCPRTQDGGKGGRGSEDPCCPVTAPPPRPLAPLGLFPAVRQGWF